MEWDTNIVLFTQCPKIENKLYIEYIDKGLMDHHGLVPQGINDAIYEEKCNEYKNLKRTLLEIKDDEDHAYTEEEIEIKKRKIEKLEHWILNGDNDETKEVCGRAHIHEAGDAIEPEPVDSITEDRGWLNLWSNIRNDDHKKQKEKNRRKAIQKSLQKQWKENNNKE